MSRWLSLPALALLFLVGVTLLDERWTSLGALPIQPHVTRASSSSETSGLAIDRSQETFWVAEDGREGHWSMAFEEPVELTGLSIDTGFHKRRGTKGFQIRLFGPDGTATRLAGLGMEHELVFSCWHVYRGETPVTTSRIELQADGRGTRQDGPWVLRDVRFLAEGVQQRAATGGAVQAGLREALVPFALGVLWLVLLLRRSDPPPIR